MKRAFLIISLIVCASSAHAALSFSYGSATIDIGETITVDIITDGSISTSYIIHYPCSYTSVVVYDGMVHPGMVTPVGGYPGYYAIMPPGPPGPMPPEPGDVVAVVSITGVSAGICEVNIYAGDWSTPEGNPGTFTTIVTPEPVTICLLGVGGLFLRRRK